MDVNKRLVKTIKSYFKLSCHGRNQFCNSWPVTADEHELYFGKISHSASLVTDFAEIQLVFVGSDRPTVTELLYIRPRFQTKLIKIPFEQMSNLSYQSLWNKQDFLAKLSIFLCGPTCIFANLYKDSRGDRIRTPHCHVHNENKQGHVHCRHFDKILDLWVNKIIS